MAEVIRAMEEPIRHASGTYSARVVGRQAKDGMWEGWFEFIPVGPGASDVVVSAIESRQPGKDTLEYWASGLTPVYAEGSLARAVNPVVVRTKVVHTAASDAPAPRVTTAAPVRNLGPDAVLDPFEVGSRSLDVLAQELRALNRPRLLNIISAFDLNPAGKDVSWMSDDQLVTFLVVAVEAQLVQRAK